MLMAGSGCAASRTARGAAVPTVAPGPPHSALHTGQCSPRNAGLRLRDGQVVGRAWGGVNRCHEETRAAFRRGRDSSTCQGSAGVSAALSVSHCRGPISADPAAHSEASVSAECGHIRMPSIVLPALFIAPGLPHCLGGCHPASWCVLDLPTSLPVCFIFWGAYT